LQRSTAAGRHALLTPRVRLLLCILRRQAPVERPAGSHRPLASDELSLRPLPYRPQGNPGHLPRRSHVVVPRCVEIGAPTELAWGGAHACRCAGRETSPPSRPPRACAPHVRVQTHLQRHLTPRGTRTGSRGPAISLTLQEAPAAHPAARTARHNLVIACAGHRQRVGERFGPFWGLTPMVCELACLERYIYRRRRGKLSHFELYTSRSRAILGF
jgi:hypothetical protein